MRTSNLHAVLAALAVFAIACEGPDDVTLPVTAFEASLSGANEIPAHASTATATGTFQLISTNPATDSLSYSLTIGAPLVGTATQAHFHAGAPNANGLVQLWLCTTAGVTGAPAGTPTCGTGAAGAFTSGTLAITPAQLNSLRTFAWYANVHSSAGVNGEIRGQVRNVPPAAP